MNSQKIVAILTTIRSLTFHFLFMVVPLVFTSVNDELFEFNKMLLVYACAIILFAVWCIESFVQKKIIWKRTFFDPFIIFFVLSQVISTLLSINIHTSIFGYYSRFNGGLLSTLAYCILYYSFVFGIKKKTLPTLFVSLLMGSTLVALYAFPEHFGHSPSCFLFTGQFDVACWVQDVKTRVFGTFGQPNWLAAYLILILPVVMAFALLGNHTFSKAKSWIFRSIFFVLFLLNASVLLYTQSRSGIAGAGLALGFFSISYLILRIRNHPTQSKTILKFAAQILLYGATFFTLLLIIGSPLNNQLFSLPMKLLGIHGQVQSTQSAPATGGTQLEVGGSESGAIRKVVWEGAVKVWKRYPLFGSGVETFAYSYYRDRPVEHNMLSEWNFLYNKAHNEFLNYLATTGTVGLVAYVLLYGSFIAYPLWIVGKEHLGDQPKQKAQKSLVSPVFSTEGHTTTTAEKLQFPTLLLAFSSGLLGLAVSNFFGFSTVMVDVLTFIFPAIVVVLSARQGTEQKHDTTDHQLSQMQWIGIGVIGICAMISILFVWQYWKADTVFARGKQLNTAGQLQQGFLTLQQAVDMLPNEPTYRDELSYSAAQISYALATNKQATQAAQFADYAIMQSKETVQQNSVHVNFWKTQARVYLLLAQTDPKYYTDAVRALEQARALSPTDTQVTYNLALIAQANNQQTDYENLLQLTLQLRPVDEQSRYALGQLYEQEGKKDLALEQYQYMLQFINPNNLLAKDRIASLSATPKPNTTEKKK